MKGETLETGDLMTGCTVMYSAYIEQNFDNSRLRLDTRRKPLQNRHFQVDILHSHNVMQMLTSAHSVLFRRQHHQLQKPNKCICYHVCTTLRRIRQQQFLLHTQKKVNGAIVHRGV